jgi:predicted glycosyltransferase
VITYVAGDPLQKKTMDRACANRAKACILMTNKNSVNSSEQDFKNILIALAVKREVFVDNQHCKDESRLNIPVCMQLIKPESRDLYKKSLNFSPL